MGRPQIPIDWDYVDLLLEAGCKGQEIAGHFGIHPTTFYHRCEEHHDVPFSEYASERKQIGNSLLRLAQYEKAIAGDNIQLLWLGKNRLEQKDNPQGEITMNLSQLVKDIASGLIRQIDVQEVKEKLEIEMKPDVIE